MNMKKIFKRMLSLVLSIACIGTVLVSTPVSASAATTVKLDTTSYTFSSLGKSYVILATISPTPLKVNYSSNNSSIAIVQPTTHTGNKYYFKVTSKGIGCTKINITANGITSSMLVTVETNVSKVKQGNYYSLNEPFVYKDSSGKPIFSLTITSVTAIPQRNPKENFREPSQVVLVKCKFENISYTKQLYAHPHFFIKDEKGISGDGYMESQEMDDIAIGENPNPAYVNLGESCQSVSWYGLRNSSKKVKLSYWGVDPDTDKTIFAAFDVDVTTE